MRDFFRRLFGKQETTPLVAPQPRDLAPAQSVDNQSRSSTVHVPDSGLTGDAAVSRYFELSGAIEAAKAKGDFASAILAARETYPLLGAVVREIKKEWGSFDIATSHAVHTASTLMAVMGERQGIRELRAALGRTPELHPWLYTADDAENDATLVDGILAAVTERPATKQADLKKCVNGDSRRLSILAAWLEKGGRLRRVREGNTYLLYAKDYPVDVSSAATPSTEAQTGSGVTTVVPLRKARPRSPVQARVINLRNIPCVRLPKAPAVWEERHRASVDKNSPFRTESEVPSVKRDALPRFLVEGGDVSIESQEKLPANDRPDPAFSRMFPSEGSTLWIDPTGKRVGFASAFAIAMTTDRAGHKLAESGLAHDVYRADINANGTGMIFLSRDGVLHGYSDRLIPLIAERVEDIPEYRAQATRFGIDPQHLKNHTRCVAISADCNHHLITVVDEAWCYETGTGSPVWGLRFPAKDGWTEVISPRSERTGPTAEIQAALHLMELSLPVSPESIARQYRVLAMRWHPDRNPHDSGATRKFQEISDAMELLTGTDLSRFPSERLETVTYQQLLHQHNFRLPDGRGITLSVTLQVGGALGADWVYAANFARKGQGTFLASYSGRVLEVDAGGLPQCIYDIGAVPRRVLESSSRRYIVTDTRLYILHGTELEALIDLPEAGNLVAGDSGFGLLHPRKVQWYTTAGRLLGSVYSRDPIRRTHRGPNRLVVETRTQRATIRVPAGWW